VSFWNLDDSGEGSINVTSTETLAILRQGREWLWRLPGGIVDPLFDLAKPPDLYAAYTRGHRVMGRRGGTQRRGSGRRSRGVGGGRRVGP